MSDSHILAIDHGTSGLRSALVSCSGEIVATEQEELPTLFFPGGGAEQDPDGWWRALLCTCRRLVEAGHVPVESIAAIAVSSTFSSTVAVDRDGRHLLNCITWMDTRGAPHVRRLMRGFPSFQGYGIRKVATWIRRTGGAPTLSGKDDLAHALLVQHEYPEIYSRTHKFLPSKDYLNLRLTGEFAASHDSVTLFWLTDTRRIDAVAWDPDLIRRTGLDPTKLPTLKAAADLCGTLLPGVAQEIGLPPGLPVVMGSPDHQSAGVGSGAVADFQAHLYVGTSSWIQCPVPFKKTDVLHSIASLPTSMPGKYYCANEQDLAGGCLSFLLSNILFAPGGITRDAPPTDGYELLDQVAAEVPAGSHNLVFTPWLNGERTPVDDDLVRGGLFNLSTTTKQEHIARAVLEGVAYNTRWSLKYVERFIGRRLPHIRIVGGGALSNTWCQIFADVLQRDIHRVVNPRGANARGAAYIGAVGIGKLRFEEVAALTPIERVFVPNPKNRVLYDRLFREFLRIYRHSRAICRRLNRVPAAPQ